jgi:hypothetical protein
MTTGAMSAMAANDATDSGGSRANTPTSNLRWSLGLPHWLSLETRRESNL